MSITKVVVTGAAGQIGYSLLALIGRGEMLGLNQHMELRLLDIEPAMNALEGVKAELVDCAFPLVSDIIITADPKVAFKDADAIILCGSFPRKPGMERKDLLAVNAKIFSEQGRIIGEVANPNCRICVVGNPANTNALILLKSAGGKLNPKHVTALTRLDHNRAISQLAAKAKATIRDVKNCIIWGNHSNTQVPDVNSATIKNENARKVVSDDAYLDGEFIQVIQQRGAQIIKLRGLSSSLSAAKAIVDHFHDWMFGTAPGTHVSMSVYSNGNPYGIPDDLIFSFPVTCKDGEWQFVPNLTISPKVKDMISATTNELKEEREHI